MSTSTLCADGTSATSSSWLGVVSIALGAFALVVMEFLPVGLLPGIVKGFGITDGLAGLTVTVTAGAGFLAAPTVALLIGRLDRRRVLLGLSGLVIASGAMSVAAPNLAVLLAARLILGVGVGGFWSVAIVAATRLVPERDAHKASSLVFSGISVASIVSVPMGAYLAAHADWRIAFAAATLLAASVLALQAISLPRIALTQDASLKDFAGLLRTPRIAAIYLTIVLVVAGHFAGYTFVSPYLRQLTGFGPGTISELLLLFGLVAVAGNFVGGAVAARNLHGTILVNVALFLAAIGTMGVFCRHPAAVVASLLAWALSWGMAPVTTQLWLASETRHAPEAAQSINTSLFQLAITLGSLAGGMAVDHIGVHASVWVGEAILVLAAMAAAATIAARKQATPSRPAA
ncbi:MFS transporter [Burkholderia cenocepacia]|uniref:MFS transporter n=1 Tax=Burkholderia cenocepacia TaxID=95486 RepID=UPI000A017A9F|nr:MFS transporter [Burkholderia cenocepacia]MCW3674616.1 MFS transporter [Burkholderia cenocepacia]MDC6082490.1 MFS transporter [Burkholderia cenocepacia]